MQFWKTYGLTALLVLISLFGFAQQDTTQSEGGNIDEIRNGFIESVGQFFDVRMLDHSIQTRGLVKKQGLKDDLDAYSKQTADKLRIALISELNLAELWPNLLNRKKYYTTEGKYDLTSSYFETGEGPSNLSEGTFLIGLNIDVDTLANKQEYTAQITGVLDQGLINYLVQKGRNTDSLETAINQHFIDFFADNPPPYASPNEIPLPEAMDGLFEVLDNFLGKYYNELLVQQTMQDLASESFPAASNEFRITFNPAGSQIYGYDWFDTRFENWADEYGFAVQGDGNIYTVDAKSIKEGVTDHVDILFEHSESIDLSLVSFKIKGGSNVSVTFTGDSATLEIPALSKGQEQLYAYYDDEPIGKLLIKVYKQKDLKVVVVPVNCDVTASNLETYLDMVYKPGVVDWTVELAPRWDDNSWDTGTPGQLEAADATLMTKYSGEMRALRDAYLDSIGDDEDKQAYYVFVVNEFTEPTLSGYMVRGKSVGFVKNNSSEVGLKRTIAHELGHGAFGMRHLFDLAPKGQTSRLMDYVSATHLTAFDWHEIHSKMPDWSRFDDEEEFLLVHVTQINELIEEFGNTDHSLTFITPGKSVITLSGNIERIDFAFADDRWQKGKEYLPIGSLVSFVVDGVEYTARKEVGSYSFVGYKDENEKLYEDKLSYSLFQDENQLPKILIGIPCISESKVDFTVFPISKVDDLADVAEVNYAVGSVVDVFGFCDRLENISQGVSVFGGFTTGVTDEVFLIAQLAEGDVCGSDAVYAMRVAYHLKKHPEYWNCVGVLESEIYNFNVTVTRTEDDEYDYQDTYSEFYISENPGLTSMDDPPIISTAQLDIPVMLIEAERTTISFVKFESVIRTMINSLNEKSVEKGNVPDYNIANIIAFFEISDYNNRECLLSSLDFDLRSDLLDALNVWQNPLWPGNWDSDKERLMLDLIRTIPDSDVSKLLEYFAQNNYQKLYGEDYIYDDLSGEQLMKFGYIFSNILLSHPDEVAIFLGKTTTGMQNNYGCYYLDNMICSNFSIPTWGQFVKGDPFPFYKNKILGSGGNGTSAVGLDGTPPHRVLSTNSCIGNHTDKIYYGYVNEGSSDVQYQLSPYDFIRVVFKDDYLYSLPNGEEIRMGTEVVVPVFWLYWLYDQQRDYETSVLIRASADMLALAISVASLGTASPLLAVGGIIFHAADASIAIMEEDIELYGSYEQKQWLGYYNSFAAIVGLAELGVGSARAVLRLNKIRLAIRAQKAEGTYVGFYSRFKDFYLGFKSLSVAGTKNKGAFESLMDQLRLEFEINKFSKSIKAGVENNYEFTVQQSKNYLVLDDLSSAQYSVGRVFESTNQMSQEVYVTLDKIYSPNSSGSVDEIIGKLEAVPVELQGNIANKTVYFVKTANSVFSRPVSGTLLSLMDKCTGNSNLSKWIISFDDITDASLITKLDELEVGYLSKLETDLASASNGSELKTLLKESPDDLNNIWKELKDDPKYAFELSKTGGSRWDRWAQSNFFKVIIKAGKDFEEYVSTNFSILRTKLLEAYPNVDLNDYAIFEQVQLKTGKIVNGKEEFFIADFVLVKKKMVLGQEILDMENSIVLETKLSSTTPLTTPQVSALDKVRSTSKTFSVRSIKNLSTTNSSFSLGSDPTSTLQSVKVLDYIKVSSNGVGNTIQDVISLK